MGRQFPANGKEIDVHKKNELLDEVDALEGRPRCFSEVPGQAMGILLSLVALAKKPAVVDACGRARARIVFDKVFQT